MTGGGVTDGLRSERPDELTDDGFVGGSEPETDGFDPITSVPEG
jgi:hypothetical protein